MHTSHLFIHEHHKGHWDFLKRLEHEQFMNAQKQEKVFILLLLKVVVVHYVVLLVSSYRQMLDGDLSFQYADPNIKK